MLNYRLTLEPDEDGTILVTSPDFPLVTFGEDRQQALHQATDAAQVILQGMMDDRDDIPRGQAAKDGDIVLRLPLQTQIKVALYAAMRHRAMTRADLQRSLGWKRESIDRLFRLDHNSKVEQLDQAFEALGQKVEVRTRPELEVA